MLYGVPRTGTSRSRRALWALLIAAAAVFTQTWMFLLMFSWLLAATIALSLGCGLAALLWTSPRRERGGAERLVLSPLGVVRLPLANSEEHARWDSAVIPLRGATLVELKRLSPVWYRLRLGTVPPGGDRVIILDAGIRCPDELVLEVRRTIEWHLQRAQAVDDVAPPAA